eukprot:3932599-Rhodomonas_salina.2
MCIRDRRKGGEEENQWLGSRLEPESGGSGWAQPLPGGVPGPFLLSLLRLPPLLLRLSVSHPGPLPPGSPSSRSVPVPRCPRVIGTGMELLGLGPRVTCAGIGPYESSYEEAGMVLLHGVRLGIPQLLQLRGSHGRSLLNLKYPGTRVYWEAFQQRRKPEL